MGLPRGSGQLENAAEQTTRAPLLHAGAATSPWFEPPQNPLANCFGHV